MVFSSGCYYGVLNVLDPTIRYDANGKIIGALNLLESDTQLPPTDDEYYQRGGPNGTRDQGYDLRAQAEEVVIVETVESTQCPLDDSQSFHPHITYVSETDMEPLTDRGPPCLIEPVEEPELVSEPVVERVQETDPQTEPVPEDVEQISQPVREQIQESVSVQDDTVEVWSVPPLDHNEEAVHVLDNMEEPSKSTRSMGAENTGPPAEAGFVPGEALPEESGTDGDQNAPAEPTQVTDVAAESTPETEAGSPAMEQSVEGSPAAAIETEPEPMVDEAQEAAQERVIEETDRVWAEQSEEAPMEQTEQPVVDLVQEKEVVDLVNEEPVVDLVQEPADEEVVREVSPEEQHEATPADAPANQPICVEDRVPSQPQSMVLVADYMEATPLFKTIQRKNWQAVLFFLRTGSFSFSPLTGSAMNHAVQEQAQTWVSKKDEKGRELWRQLPLHAAICFGASQKVVEKLILAYPQALKSPDCHGNLPLHLAYIFDSDDTVIALLMKSFPAGLHVMNFKGLQPIQCSNEISSETFQYNAELFGALSDYTRAVAENDPDKLTEQLQEVRKQLKSVNDTLFASASPRQPDPIKEYMKASPPAMRQNKAPSTMVEFGPGAFIREVAFGLCSGVHNQVEHEMAPTSYQDTTRTSTGAPADVIMLDDAPMPAPSSQICRVMEYDPKTKTWKEV